MSEDSCKTPNQIASAIKTCITGFDAGKISKSPFGKGLNNIPTTDITYSA